MIREAIEAQARAGAPDDVALESLRNDIAQMIDSITKAIERAREFSLRGLVSEAASVVEDFPDLARQADALAARALLVEAHWPDQTGLSGLRVATSCGTTGKTRPSTTPIIST